MVPILPKPARRLSDREEAPFRAGAAAVAAVGEEHEAVRVGGNRQVAVDRDRPDRHRDHHGSAHRADG
jgi:hypothetical protein